MEGGGAASVSASASASTEGRPEEEAGQQPAADDAASESPAVEPRGAASPGEGSPGEESERKGAEGSPGEAQGPPDEAEGPPDEGEGPPDEAAGPPDEGEAPPDEGEGLAGEAEGLSGEAEGAAGEAAEPPGEGEAPEEVPSMASLFGGLPTSASFAAGEPSEPPALQVSEALAAAAAGDISLSLWELDQQVRREGLEPGSSSDEEEDDDDEEKEEARRAEEQRQRTELVEQYRQLVLERSRLRRHGARLQSKLAEALNKAKGKERPRAELEQHVSDKEQRYSRYLAMLQELRSQQREELAWYQQQADELHQACDQKLAKVDKQWKAYQASKKEVAVYTMGRRLGGRQAAIYKVDQIQRREESKEKEMTEVYLKNIKLKHRIIKLEANLKAQEELAEGLHLIDFEQLKIENQTYNEKIEERNEELLKFRGKITNTVQVITQVKEKLQFVEAENQGRKVQLMAVEALMNQKRDSLTKTKQARDRLRIDNEKLYQKSGLLGDTVLLRDFEEKVNVVEVLKQSLDILKHQHAGLALTCEGVKKKIRGIKSFLPL